MSEEYASIMPVPGSEAIASVAAASPNDATRRQTANRDPNRYCNDNPHVPTSHDMGRGEKGEY